MIININLETNNPGSNVTRARGEGRGARGIRYPKQGGRGRDAGTRRRKKEDSEGVRARAIELESVRIDSSSSRQLSIRSLRHTT